MKDKIYPDVLSHAATLKVELLIKPGRIPWIAQTLRFSAAIDFDLPHDKPIWPYFVEACRKGFESMRVEIVENQVPPAIRAGGRGAHRSRRS